MSDSRRQAFERALEHWRSVFGFARQFTPDVAAAEDLAQEAYLELWKREATLDLERPLLPLLFATVRNRARSRARADRIVATDELGLADVDSGESPHELAGAAEERGLLRAALATLPPHWRGALFLVDGIDLAYRDAATALGMTDDVLRVTLHRARQRLRERVGRTVPGGES